MTQISVTILTGFLGAGKTTFLKRIMSEPGFGDTAVIVNEFGEAGIDGLLIARADEQAVEMTTGCICCTISGDVRSTLLRLLDRADQGYIPSFGRVVIETTGLADPLPLLQTFMRSDNDLDRFKLSGLVTLVDAVFGAEAIERFPEARRQVDVADLLLVTKSDLARDPATWCNLEDLNTRLSRQNPNAPILYVNEATAGMIFSLAATDRSDAGPHNAGWPSHAANETHSHDHHDHHDNEHHSHNGNQHGDTATAFCFTAMDPIDPPALDRAIEALQTAFGSDLLRVKGLVEITGHPRSPRAMHVIGHVSSPAHMLKDWPPGIANTRMVAIVSGPARGDAPRILRQYLPGLTDFVPGPHS